MLTHEQARAFYDRFGARQDWQRFYEATAERFLIAHAALAGARAVLEFGCGTGRLAETLLERHLPPDATYLGVDLSFTMVSLARARLARFGQRAQVVRSTGAPVIEAASGTFDRFLSMYVLDLLSPEDTAALIAEAHRVTSPAGLAGFVSLTHGFTVASWLVERAWSALYAWRPSIVGGCRPISVREQLPASDWEVREHERVSSFGVPSEIVVARALARARGA